MTLEPQFSLQGLSFGYLPQQPLLEDLNMNISAGESLVLLGANGCGNLNLAVQVSLYTFGVKMGPFVDEVNRQQERLKGLVKGEKADV